MYDKLEDKQYEHDGTELNNYKILQKHGVDITKLAAKKKIDPIIGRDKEIKRLTQVLCRKTKNNPILIWFRIKLLVI